MFGLGEFGSRHPPRWHGLCGVDAADAQWIASDPAGCGGGWIVTSLFKVQSGSPAPIFDNTASSLTGNYPYPGDRADQVSHKFTREITAAGVTNTTIVLIQRHSRIRRSGHSVTRAVISSGGRATGATTSQSPRTSGCMRTCSSKSGPTPTMHSIIQPSGLYWRLCVSE
jgi:hypothetical protein